MKALILPNNYCSKETLQNEEDQLFKKVWNFVGFKSSLQNYDDFLTLEIAGTPLVVQNCKGEIRGFKNICSHRHSIIQVEKSGNRPLLCPYHGWAYNEKGIPTGIPKKPLFKFSKEEIECLKLKEYRVEFCGSLIFVNLSDNAESLQDYIGDLFSEIEKMSSNYGDLLDVNTMDIQANWKILVENTLESYHVNLIHEETFKKLGAGGMKFSFVNDHSVWDATLLAQENEGKSAKVHRPFQDREYKIDGYKHLMIFPNVLISTTYGVSFNLSFITPIDEKSSRFVSYVFITKTILKQNRELTLSTGEKIYRQSLVDFNRKVFDEDKQICEKVQLGVKHSHMSGELSDEEARVCEFQRNYQKYLS
jgi:phenylpropionate dioxygenase-like ring-hydroxylating dioxygenase large terminal subunit